jgi:hypothetical protein
MDPRSLAPEYLLKIRRNINCIGGSSGPVRHQLFLQPSSSEPCRVSVFLGPGFRLQQYSWIIPPVDPGRIWWWPRYRLFSYAPFASHPFDFFRRVFFRSAYSSVCFLPLPLDAERRKSNIQPLSPDLPIMVSTPTFGATSLWSLPEVASPQRVRDDERQASSRVCDNCIR